jgi:hypothetical protein
MHLYEYAILRVVPSVEREEFINVGVILNCKQQGLLFCKVYLDEKKLNMLDQKADVGIIHSYLESFRQICEGQPNGSPIALQDATSRFRWLTAVRSSVIQTSRPHSGFSDDLHKTLEELFDKYVQ